MEGADDNPANVIEAITIIKTIPQSSKDIWISTS
jgi:hypothetical protein